MGDATLIVLTNYATSEVQRVCTELGAVRVFDKSMQLEELVAFCRQLQDTMPPPLLN